MLSNLVRYKNGIPALVVAGVLLLLIGIWIGRSGGPAAMTDNPAMHDESAHAGQTIWTCSMHPQIRQPEPGKCPICGMDLIPATNEENDSLGPRSMSMSEEAMRLAEIETVKAERRFVDAEIRLSGAIDYDERKLKTIAAWIPGRLERLFVDYTGVPVKQGDHLVKIYSPELYASQEELLQAIRALSSLKKSASESVLRSTKRMVDASREKLRLLGLSAEQVAEIETRGTASATVQINAPVGGIVIHKNAVEGSYVKTGTPIYTLADLSIVWANLDAYESDIAWLRYGQEVEIKTESYGDRVFKGWISFLDPVLNPQTRTIKVRVVVQNPDGMLRPNMFVRAVVKARIAKDGEVVTRTLTEKWISPMHPEVVKDKPGKCDVCGMALVKASDLGYADQQEAAPPLVVPASAVLTTGERAVVYVRVPDMEKPTFEGVEVAVGPRAGKYFIVLSGLREGQEVVTKGNFKIDSALQLLAKPSMMNPVASDSPPMDHTMHGNMSDKTATPESPMPMRVSPAFLEQLEPLYSAYMKTQEALASDNEKQARQMLDLLATAATKVDMTLVQKEAHMQWMDALRQLNAALEHREHMQGINGARKTFQSVSNAVIRIEKTFGHAGEKPHRIAFCPMADNGKGAEWLQTGETVNNPYYGEAMLRCGEIRKTIPGTKNKGAQHGQKQ